MKIYYRLCLLLVLFAFQAPAIAIDIEDPPIGTFADEWYAVMMKGKKCGFMHSSAKREKTPQHDHIIMNDTIYMIVARGPQKIEISMKQGSRETLTGEPLSFINIIKASTMDITKKGIIQDGKVKVTISQFGQEMKRTFPLPEGARMSWGVYLEQVEHELKPGNKFELQSYEPASDLNSLVSTTIEVIGPETIDLFGRKVEAIKTKETMVISNLLGGQLKQTAYTWVNKDWDILRTETDIIGNRVEILACTKTVALAKNDPAELMLETFVKANRRIDEEKVSKVSYRMELKKASEDDLFSHIPETDIQKIIKKEKNRVDLLITKRSALPPDRPPQPLTENERQNYLAPSTMINYQDPVIAQLAKEAAGTEKDPWKLADKLRKFVGNYIHDKNLSVGFASASEVARSKEGDCTEHGILLAALGRAHGFPTRVIMGMAYTDRFLGRSGIFVGHLWTQFYIDGRWVDLDASLQETDVKPTHIALYACNPSDSGLADLVSSILLSLNQLKITVLETE